MRIIAGKYKGRKLEWLKSDSIRPTKDRIRESVFNILGQDLTGLAVLDLFAGSGAYGLEASSRGAEKVVFVENNKESCDFIRKNIVSIKVDGFAGIINQDVYKTVKDLGAQKEAFSLIFCDPPYKMDHAKKSLNMIYQYDILIHSGLLVLEHHKEEILPEVEGDLYLIKKRIYGYNSISIYKRK